MGLIKGLVRYSAVCAMLLGSLGASAGTVVIPGDVTLDSHFSGLSGPLAARHAGDGSGRVFMVEQDGLIRIWDGAQILATPFLNLSNVTTASGEQGLLGLAFHPNYASNGRFYVNFTADGLAGVPFGTTVVAEYQVSAGNPNVADPNSRRVLLTIRQDFGNHNGGDVHFGDDGYLYIGMGDGGSGNDPCNRAQTLDPANIVTGGGCINDPTVALLGKMLRIDVDNTTPAGSNELCGAAGDGSAEYAIPPSNPFSGADNTCDEVWAYGLRNPFRFSFDRLTHDLWIGDVGQNVWEEIDFELADEEGGLNYGWRECEGLHPRGNTNPGSVCAFPSVPPVLEYIHSGGSCSVTGGFRYRGPVASLDGTYIFGDFCTGVIRFAQETAPGVFEQVNTSFTVNNLSGFGEDQDGELYAISLLGEVFRFNGIRTDVIYEDGFEDPPPP